MQQFPAHLELAREGDRADFLHVVIDGRSRYSRHILNAKRHLEWPGRKTPSSSRASFSTALS